MKYYHVSDQPAEKALSNTYKGRRLLRYGVSPASVARDYQKVSRAPGVETSLLEVSGITPLGTDGRDGALIDETILPEQLSYVGTVAELATNRIPLAEHSPAQTPKWINHLDLELIDPYPLQFANVDRLTHNDVVCIFDEVGCGKTISAGLMALSYLDKRPEDKVLVITTNALIKNNQFKDDWFMKLPFKQLGLEHNVTFVNNHYSNFRTGQRYGLVIIDEAHLFLNKETKRYGELVRNIRADKVVFLTATPIKDTSWNLTAYADIARNLTGKTIDNRYLDSLGCQSIPLCSAFNVKLPVTRYFKDTVMALQVENYEKRAARRYLPHIWEYTGGIRGKDQALADGIKAALKNFENSHFVIFTRYVETEALRLRDYLRHEFEQSASARSVDVVTGENSTDLCRYSGTDNLPTVLILTYQIAEQGVNLPGFNYIINYHIAASAAALEQRFGRIDRMGRGGSLYKEIHTCYLVSTDGYDQNTLNFYTAVFWYMKSVLTHFPSRNVVLTKEVLDWYKERTNLLEACIATIKDLATRDNVARVSNCINADTDAGALQPLLNFVIDNDIECTNVSDDPYTEIHRELSAMSDAAKNGRLLDPKKCEELLSVKSDDIFYYRDGKLCTIKATDCSDRIVENSEYQKYAQKFKEQVRFVCVLQKYKANLNRYYERAFDNNDFWKLFPLTSTQKYDNLEAAIEECGRSISKDDAKLLLSRTHDVLPNLPFYKMCDEFRTILHDRTHIQENGKPRVRYRLDENPLVEGARTLGRRIWWDPQHFGLSPDFVKKYWESLFLSNADFNIKLNSFGRAEASNWSKLAYQCTRREVECVFYTEPGCSQNKNLFQDREDYLVYVSELYDECDRDEAAFFRVRYEEKIALELGTDIMPLPTIKSYDSLFHLTLFTYNDNPRAYSTVERCTLVGDANKYRYKGRDRCDIWTQGIIYEITGQPSDITWDTILPLPKATPKLCIYE